MERLRAGFLILIAGGITMIVAGFVPWAQVDAPPLTFYAWQLHLYAPLATCLVVGALLIAFALRRSLWAGLVGMLGALAAGLAVIMIHGNLYVGLNDVAPWLRLGDTVHVAGYGVSALFAAGLLAGFGGLIATAQTAPKVET